MFYFFIMKSYLPQRLQMDNSEHLKYFIPQ